MILNDKQNISHHGFKLIARNIEFDRYENVSPMRSSQAYNTYSV